MAICRTITCDMPHCATKATESAPNVGWAGWGQIKGVILNGTADPYACPECMARIMNYVDAWEAPAP